MPSNVPVVSVRLTKTFLKALEDLKKAADHCPDAKTQKQLVRIEKTLHNALVVAAGNGANQQRGGMAPLNPAILNTSDLIDHGRGGDIINVGDAGRGLLNIPAPFSDAIMGSGAVLTDVTAPLYVPNPSPLLGGAAASTGGKQNRRRK